MKKFLVMFLLTSLFVCAAAMGSALADDLEKGLRHDLQQSHSAIARAQKKLQGRESIAAEAAVLKGLGEKVRASHLLMIERLRQRKDQASLLGANAISRQSEVAEAYTKAVEEYLALLDSLPADGSVSPATLELLNNLIDKIAPPKKRAIIGALPYKHLAYPAHEPATGPVLVPAYKGGNRTVTQADTAASVEAPISKEIADLAQSLQWNPVLIYEWVKNNVETEWYWGAMKGAEETFRQKSGNDADQAALLTALLRASGFPTRFVKGTIEFFPGIEHAKNLTGIDDPLKIADFFRKAGIPSKPVVAGGGIANLQLEHVWVECQIPYSNYRGAVVDDFGKTWLGLDTAIKPSGYTRSTPLEIPQSVDASVPGEYLQGVQDQTPLELLRTKAGAYLDANQPGKGWQDLLATRHLNQGVLKILPSSMQFKQVAVTGEYTELPVELRHRVRFSATANGSELFSLSLDVLQVSNRRLSLGYEPETVEDQQIIDSYGGLDNTPSYLVRLRPVLRLDGERQVVAGDGLPMGAEFTLNTEMITPNGTETVTSSQIVGNLAVIGVIGQKANAVPTIAAGDDAETILFKEAIGYIDRWNKSEEELAGYYNLAVARPVATTVTVGGVIDVSYLMDIPHGFEWKGVFIDAALRAVEVASRSGVLESERDFMRLSAMQGSVLESRIFEDDLKVGAVSTAKVLQLAAQQGVPILSLDKSNVDTLLPSLSLDEAVKSDIADAVNQNLAVKVPQTEITYRDWTGIGYLKENLETGASGWMLSGQLAGGMTAWRADLWPDAYAAVLQNAYSEPPVYDSASATSIAKITATEFQDAEVGKPLPLPLQVRVTDGRGRPVKGAEVTFSVKAGGGSFAGNAQSITALTNTNGVASASLTVGKYTKENPTSFWEAGASHPQQVGENVVDATLATGVRLQVPFTVYAFPGRPVRMRPTYGDALWGNILSFASFVAVVLEDEFGNPASNLPVTYTVADPVPDPNGVFCPSPAASSQKTYLAPTNLACLNNAPVWGECGDTNKQVLTVGTGTFGAPAQIIMGGTPGALYRINATCKGDSVPTACVDPATGAPFTVTFNRYTRSFGSCSDGSDPVRQLFLDSVMLADETGRVLNAGKAGATVPIKAKLFYLREGETTASASIDCGGSTLTCSKAVGTGGYTVDTIVPGTGLNDAWVRFGDLPGTRVPDTGESKGVYTTDYPLQPGVNKVLITGRATIGVPSTTMACPSTCSTSQNAAFTNEAYKTIELYGVGIQVQDVPTLQINQAGELQQDLKVSYSISPAAYRAGTAYVVVYRQDEPVAYIPSETFGLGSATVARGFRFDMQSSYSIEVVLNPGTASEIRGGKVPINLVGPVFEVERNHLLAKFDSSIPAGTDWSDIDSYKIFDFIIKRSASVKVLLLDAALNQKAVIVPQTTLAAGSHHFVLDYGQVTQAGFNAVTQPKFHLQVLYTPADGNPPYARLYPGRVAERSSGRMLGQVMVHDVLIQDGSLNLSRQDFAFKGRGPQLSFSRSYNNHDAPVGPKPLGEGWRHSLDMKLYPISAQASGAGPVPDWVAAAKGKFLGNEPLSQSQAWTTVQVSEGTFRKYGNVWYSERGRHGKLEEVTGGFLFTAKDGTRYRYDYPTAGETPVRSISDRSGNVMSFSYDADGQLSRVTDSVGRNCDFNYRTLSGLYSNDNTRLTGVVCSDNMELSFAYNEQGYLESVRRGARVESYHYAPESAAAGARLNLVKATDSNNNSFIYEYFGPNDSFPNQTSIAKLRPQDVVKKVQYPDLKSASFAYDLQSANKRTVTDLRNYDTVYTLNFYGNPLRIDEPLGKTTRMTWSIDEGKNDNVMTSKTDARGYTTLYDYDPQGNVVKETDPYQNSITTTWNQKFSLPELRTDRNGVIQRWKYDNLNGNLLDETDGDGKKTSYQYNVTGERVAMVDPRGNQTAYSYDQWGNLASVTGQEGSLTRYEYDIRGRRTASTDPKGRRTSYAYDSLDYPASVTFPALSSYSLPAGSSNVKTIGYDAVGNLLSETDRLGLTLDYSYTPRNQVQSIRRSAGGLKSFSYDENGNLLSESDWKGVATSHSYDALNRRITTVNRLGDTTKMGYDLNGNLETLTDAEGRVTNYVHDKLNRLTDTVQPVLLGQLPGHLVNTYYNEADPKTNLKIETDQEGNSTTYEYNGRYLRSKKTDAAGGIHLWAYDDSDNLAGETDEEGRSTTFEYDRQNRRTKMIQPGNIVTAYAYDLVGNRTHVVDPRGNDTETRFDEWNRVWQVVDPDHYVVITELDGEGNQVRSVDGNGNVRNWTRDQRGLVLTATDAEWSTTTFGYDLNGNKTSVTDANGTVTKVAYDAEDRQTLTTEALGQLEERTTGVLAYDKVGNAVQVKDGNGNVTLTDYNVLNLPGKVTDPLGHFTETGYYRTGKPKAVRNRRGAVTLYEYDQLNRVVKVTDPLLQTIVNSYDKVGNVRTVTDKRGILAETIYDELNRPIEKRRANVRLLTNEYDGAGNLTAVIDANGNRTEKSYGKRNLLDTTTFADGNTTKRSYDGVGNLLTETDEEGKVTSYTYDKENRQTSIELAGEKTDKIYDAIGNLIAEIKPESNSRTMEYDRLKRLAAVTDASLTTRYAYDKNGNLLNQYDPKGNRVEYTWDELNRKSAHIQHKGSGNLTTSFHYDEEGNLDSKTDSKGQTFGYVYDPLNRRTDESYPAQSTPFLTLVAVKTQYDGNNNVTGITETKTDSQGGTVTDATVNIYDEFDRLTGSTQRGVNVAYSYDANGNRTSVATGSGSTAYAYDKRNRVLTANVGSATTSFEYYPDGKKKTVSYPNGAGISYAYYPSNRVQAITNTAGGATISSYAYSYDRNGNRLTQTEVQNGGSSNTNYSYDTLDRMISFTVTGPTGSSTNEYTFDGYNRATEKVTAVDGSVVTKSYSYDETDWLTRVEDGAKIADYSYDANGNTIRKRDSSDPGHDTVFQYDSANRLVRSMRGTTVLGLYDYDAEGMRIRHRNSDRGDVDYFYDGRSVIEERTAAGALLACYNYADRLMSLATGSDTQYYHFDALGSTVNLTDAAGSTKVSYFLNPWGMILSQIGESTNRRVFTGKEEDVNTGLVYFGQRYYDADTGRFISQDSYLGEPGTPPSLHRYLYAYSNPTVYIDLLGYASKEASAWDSLTNGAQEAWEGTKTALSRARKALPVISREVNKVPEKVANSFTPKTTAEQLLATALYTTGEFVTGNILAPLSAAASVEEARENPTKVNIGLAILATSPYAPKGSGKVVKKLLSKEVAAGEKLLTKEAVSGANVVEKEAVDAAKSGVQANKAAGDAFEQQIMGELQQTQTGVVQQVTVKTQSGVKTRIDLIGLDVNGNIVCTECKASATAPLTKNQAAAFPEIEQSGGVVVGKGKPGFTGGTQIPPTTVDIVRP